MPMCVPKFATFGAMSVEILRTGHFPDTLIVLDLETLQLYEVEFKTINFEKRETP